MGQARALLLRGGHIIDPSQSLDIVGDLLIAEGKVSWVGERREIPSECLVLNAEGMVVSPGFVDFHCHLREPGFEYKETIATGVRAAVRGGFTTICCMPNTNPPIDSRATVEYIKRAAEREGVARVLPIGCVTKRLQGEELAEMAELAEAGVVAFSDDHRPVVSSHLMRCALEYSRAFGLPVSDHCEDLVLTEGSVMNEGWVATRLGLRGMPAAAEEAMVARDIALAELSGGWVHIAHVSTAGTVELIRRGKEKGIAVTGEVTPHHLTLTEEKVMGGGGGMLAYDTNAKVNPPLRTAADNEALVQGLKDGVIDILVTDHTPHAVVEKECEFGLANFGITSFETALGSFLSVVHRGELDLVTLISRLTADPARFIQRDEALLPGLGTLKPGAPADVVIFDPDAEWVVDPQAFASKGKNTPLAGSVLKGKVMATLFGGEMVYKDDSIKLERMGNGRTGE